MNFTISHTALSLFSSSASFLIETSFLWVPFVLFILAFHLWMRYIRLFFISTQEPLLLEIKLPADIQKSPRAMELVLTQLFQTGASKNFIVAFWDGNVRPWFSLELASIDGNVHFFIWTWKKYKNIVESQIYAQYPSVEIFEVPDYTYPVVHDLNKMGMWGTYFIPRNDDVYPLKTYIDYKLDQKEGAEEEEKVDPLTSLIEYLGSLKKGEQAWIQILIQAHRKEKIKDGRLIPREDWKQRILETVKKKRGELREEVPSITGDGTVRITRVPTTSEKDTIDAIERSIDKFPFETMIRAIYLAENESFTPPNIPGLIGSVRQFGSNNMNELKLGWFTDFDHPWKDFRRIRRSRMERQMLEAYKRRSFFQPPFRNFHAQPYVLTTEELATLFHFPGGVSTTPTFARISSRKSEAPTNLPT